MKLTALILAGGRGSRLEPWHAPKCLVPINGVTILHRLLTHLKDYLSDVVVCTGYRASDVQASIREELWDFDTFLFSDAGVDASMCKRIVLASKAAPAERYLVMYADELADVMIEELVRWHEKRNAMMTLTAWRHTIPFGVFEDEKPYIVEKHVLVNIGFAVMDARALDYAQGCDTLTDLYDTLANNGQTTEYFVHGGRRATINNPSDIANAEEVFK